MMIDPEFWRGRRVFLTGHTGFKGSWLSLWLTNMGAQVTGMSLPPLTTPDLFNTIKVEDKILSSTIGNICDATLLLDTMKAARPEIIIHMAAQPLVRYSYAHPVETYATNVMGTVHVLDAIRQMPQGSVRATVIVTSDKCYENRDEGNSYNENDAMGGNDPYSSSKGCAELVTTAYRNSYFAPEKYHEHGVAIASARAGNVIGGGDWAADRLIPDTICAMNAGQAVNIRSPNAVRPWQHVLEPLAGYLILAQGLYEYGTKFSGGWNFGPDVDGLKTVRWIVDFMTATWGMQARWKIDENLHPHEAGLLLLDSSKARKQLGWRSMWTLEQTLSRTIAWYKAYEAQEDMTKYCLAEISDYHHDSAKKYQ